MKAPKVSVIIPNYNHEKFLEERIESILNQSYQDFEIIFLDDFSTDDSLLILDKYKEHPKVSHYIINLENSGSLFKQWIKGIELARGNFIWIAESDDTADKNFLNKTVELAEQSQDFGLVFVKSIEIDSKSNPTGKILAPLQLYSGDYIHGVESVSECLVKQMLISNVSGVLFNAEKLKNIDYLKLKTFQNTGDRFTYIQIALQSRAYYLDLPLNTYRNHDNNTTKLNVANHRIYNDRYKIVKELLPVFNNNEIALKNLFTFYIKNIFIFFRIVNFLSNTKTLNRFKRSCEFISKTNYVQLQFLLLFVKLFRSRLPLKIRKYYKKSFITEYGIKI